MLRRVSVVALVLFVAALAVVQVFHSSPAARAWLDGALAAVTGRQAPAPVAAPAPAPPPSAPGGSASPSDTAIPEAGGALPGSVAQAPLPTPAPGSPGGARVTFEEAGRDPEDAAPPPEPRDVTPPPPPADLFAESDGPRIRLSWPASEDAEGVERYEVLRGGEVLVSTSSLSALDETATPLTRFCYTVVARDAAGNRSLPSREACATLADLVPPTAPTALQARPTSETSVALTWSGATDAGGIVSYDVVRAGAVIATADSPRSADSGVLPGRTYCWVVRARDAAGNVSKDSPEACATVRDQTPPAPPPGFLAAPASPTRVAFAWQPAIDNVGVDHYEVLRDGRLVLRNSPARVSGVVGELEPSTEYCFTVIALDAAGNRSRPSTPACARTSDPGTPAGPTELALTPSPRSPSAVMLRWEVSPEPGVVYTVYWDDNKRIGATPRNEYTVSGLRPGEHRCFRVSAIDSSGKESPSTIAACSTGAPKD